MVVAGGMAELPYFRSALLAAISVGAGARKTARPRLAVARLTAILALWQALLDDPDCGARYACVRHLVSNARFAVCPCAPSVLAWVGASVLAAADLMRAGELSAAQWRDGERRPPWTTPRARTLPGR